MFISTKRYLREVQALQSAGNRLTDAVLSHVSQGIFLLDANDKVLQPVSRSMTTLFRRRDFTLLTFENLLKPVLEPEVLNLALTQWKELRAATGRGDLSLHTPLQEVEVRLPKPDGSYDLAHYAFDFFAVEVPGHVEAWMVRVTDRSLAVRQARELNDLRPQLSTARPELDELRLQCQAQAEILQSVLQMGRVRFAACVQRSGAALRAITAILKKPAREEAAFRQKLEETLSEVAHIRREAATLRLESLEHAARLFEESLQELRSRETLSGSDFLPLAVRLDALFGQFSLLRSLTQTAVTAKPKPKAEAAPARMTENGTEILATPQFLAEQGVAAEPLAGTTSTAPVGSLESTLAALTEHVAAEHEKQVTLECVGLQKVPAVYQAPVKNIAIQLIRNAVIHGVESPAQRESAGKPPRATLHLQFSALPDGTFELRFHDDGRGVDPQLVRQTAVERRLITAEAAARLRDRQVIKLIFRDGFSTLPSPSASTANDSGHGAGLSFVRRHVHDAGGKVALSSEPGRETRFKVTLPALAKRAPAEAAAVA
jgi:signal transduction histidine kinase